MERDRHREPPSGSADLPEWMQGLWLAGKWLEFNVVPDRLTEEVSIHAKVRDSTVAVRSSLQEVLQGNFFYWMDRDSQHFRSEMSQILKRDTLLLERLLQLREFCHQWLEAVSSDDRHRTSLECAILEAAVAIEKLGAEYVPKNIIEEKKEKKKSAKKNRIRWPNLSWFQQGVPLPVPAQPEAPFAAQPLQTQRSSVEQPSSEPPKNPLIFKRSVLGIDRRGQIRAKNNRRLTVDSWSSQFMVEKVWDAFDPVTGDLSCNAPRRSLELFPTGSNRVASSVFLQSKDFALTDEISVPRPLVSGYDPGQRWKDLAHRSRYRLSGIDMRTDGGKIIVATEALLPFLQEDSLGNITLSLDSGLLGNLPKNVLLHSEFSTDFGTDMRDIFCSGDTGHLQRMDDQQKERLLRFLPIKMAQLLESAIRKSEQGLLLDDSVSQLLVSYLGNHYLSYHKNDAPPLKHDPAAYTQADRVFHQRRSTCEGAHVALAPLLQALQQDGEGINFVTGFVTEGGRENTAYGRDYHMQMLCSREGNVPSQRKLVLLDATPWSMGVKKQIRKKSKLRTGVRKKWKSGLAGIFDERRARGLPVIDDSPEARMQVHALDEDFGAIWAMDACRKFPSDQFPDVSDAMKHLGIGDLIAGVDTAGRSVIGERGLLDYLAKRYDIGDECSRLLKAQSHSWVEGSCQLSLPGLKLLDHTCTQKDVTKWMGDFESFFQRRKLLKKLFLLTKQAQTASCQNIEVFEEVFAVLKMMSFLHGTQLKAIFDNALLKFGPSSSTIWSKAPWMNLLPNPLKHVQDFFRRSADAETLGFLLHDQRDISADAQCMVRLQAAGWHERIQSRKTEIQEILADLPAEVLLPATPMQFPAMVLLKNRKGRVAEGTFDTGNVDAERLWAYIRTELINRIPADVA